MNKKMHSGFREIEHTADLGIEVTGDSLNNLFKNAAQGFYAVSAGDLNLSATDTLKVSLNAESAEDLLVSFLNELNYYMQMKNKIYRHINNINIEERDGQYFLSCSGQVARLNPAQREELTEIKSVTYHQLKIERKEDGYYTKVFFDI